MSCEFERGKLSKSYELRAAGCEFFSGIRLQIEKADI